MATQNSSNYQEPRSFLAAALKELVIHQSASSNDVPSLYMFKADARSGTAGAAYDESEADDDEDDEAELPVIDFSKLSSEDEEERSKELAALALACEAWGFFLVANHGVPEELMRAMLHQTRCFFNLSVEEKRALLSSDCPSDVLNPVRCGTSFNPAVEETRYWRDYLKVFVHPEFHAPAMPEGFRDVSEEYAAHIRKFTKDLLGAIFQSLGMEASEMDNALALDAGQQILIANLYPPCPQPDITLGLPAHSDHGLLTVLIQNGVDGLQVRHGRKWVRVRGVPGLFLVNVADHLEIISNGKYKSILHRVVVSDKATRISLAMAHGPPMWKAINPAPKIVAADGGRAKYKAMEYGEYVRIQQSNRLHGKSVLDLLRID